MFVGAISQWISVYVLLSLSCCDSVPATTTETARRLKNDGKGWEYGEDHILRYNIFRFTTTKRYLLEDSVPPTHNPAYYGERNPDVDFFMYNLVIIFLVALVLFFVTCCIKCPPAKNWCSTECFTGSSRSPEAFSAVQRPPERTDLFEELHRPPTGRNQFSDSRELFDEPGRTDLLNELASNPDSVNATEVATALVNSRRASDETGNVAGGKPPDYTTVVLGDLVNPTKPIFPVVKKNNETPPPQYGKENSFFK